jgi:hypothetical protein
MMRGNVAMAALLRFCNGKVAVHGNSNSCKGLMQ